MSNTVIVYKNDTNVIQVDLPFEIADGDSFTSQIREDKISTSTLIATWVVEIEEADEDHTLLKLTIDNSNLTEVTQTKGYMDIKHVSGGEPSRVFKSPLRVRFKDVVTT